MTKHQQSEPNAQPASDGGSSEWPTMNDIRIHEAVKKWSEPADSTPAQPASEPSAAVVEHYKRASRDYGDLFCWCVQNLEKFPPLEGRWTDEVKRRLSQSQPPASEPSGREAERYTPASLFDGWLRHQAKWSVRDRLDIRNKAVELFGLPAAPAGEREEADTDPDQILAMCGPHWVDEETKRVISEAKERIAALEASHAALQAKLDAVAGLVAKGPNKNFRTWVASYISDSTLDGQARSCVSRMASTLDELAAALAE
jgi:hypothetical protein